MNDLINKDETLKVIGRLLFPNLNADYIDGFAEGYNAGIRDAEPKKGKWIPHSEKSREYIGTALVNVEYDYWFCDTCGYRVENGQPIHNFCPHCGAKMEVEE